jgi:hypothetical protein
MYSLTGALADFMAFIPKLLGALVILLVGWLVAKAVQALVTKGLQMVRFNQIADRAEIDQFLMRAGVHADPASVVGRLAYWFLMLTFFVAAFSALGLPQVSGVLEQIIGFIPNLVVALVILLLGALAANFVANLVRGATGTARVGDPDLLATIARSAILVFAVLMAFDQLGIAPTIVDTLWIALIGMVAVAGALAFGLGGRDLAGRLLEDWYNRGRMKAAEARQETARSEYTTGTRSATTSVPPPMPATGAERRAA